MPHLHVLLHGSALYNGHILGPVKLTPVAERLAVELSLRVLKTWVSAYRGSNRGGDRSMKKGEGEISFNSDYINY